MTYVHYKLLTRCPFIMADKYQGIVYTFTALVGTLLVICVTRCLRVIKLPALPKRSPSPSRPAVEPEIDELVAKTLSRPAPKKPLTARQKYANNNYIVPTIACYGINFIEPFQLVHHLISSCYSYVAELQGSSRKFTRGSKLTPFVPEHFEGA